MNSMGASTHSVLRNGWGVIHVEDMSMFENILSDEYLAELSEAEERVLLRIQDEDGSEYSEVWFDDCSEEDWIHFSSLGFYPAEFIDAPQLRAEVEYVESVEF
jgi:hypothetical protein